MSQTLKLIIVFLFAGLLFYACNNEYYPKPKGNFRIDLPEKSYQKLNLALPYAFEYPVYSNVEMDLENRDHPYWINISFPAFKGKLHLSYKSIDGNLNEYLEDTRTMVMKHIPKASAINNKTFENRDKRIYGVTYHIEGVGAASPYQFYVTDSSSHFLRGALYFNVVPNNDSLDPVITFLIEDINHMVETLEWK
jgi:gliding motility-associated lipoprotein GldD